MQPHIQAALKLVGKRLEGAGYIPGPDNVAVFLGPGPAAPQQIHHRRMHGDRGPYNIPPLDERDWGGGYLHTGQPNELWSYGEEN